MSDFGTAGYWKAKYDEEVEIVNRCWSALGIATYESAGGKTIYEHIAALRKPRPEGEARDATRYRRLASFALPRYTVKHVTGDSASTYKEHELVILFQSWDAVGEALDALAPQGSEEKK